MFRVIKQSTDYVAKVTGKSWNDFIDNLEDYGFDIDSAYRYSPEQFIQILKDGKLYEAEVTKYSDGSYEMLAYNVREIIDD